MAKVILDTAELDEELKEELKKHLIVYHPLRNGHDVEYVGERSALRSMIDRFWVDCEGHLKALIVDESLQMHF